MKRKRLVSTFLIIAIALVWLLGAVLVATGLYRSSDRTRQLGAIDLDRLLGAERSQLEMAIRSVEQGLAEEAATFSLSDSVSDHVLIQRWALRLRTDPSLSAITLANESGDASILDRGDTMWTFTSVSRGSKNGPPLVTTWAPNDRVHAHMVTHIGERAIDPRGLLWFSQSLEARQRTPTWTMDSTQGFLEIRVATLIRSARTGDPYQVLCFTISPDRLVERISKNATSHLNLFMAANGMLLQPVDSSKQGQSIARARRIWGRDRDKEVFEFEQDERSMMAQVVPLQLNGTTWYTGAVIEVDQLRGWTSGERWALWTAVFILLIFAVLLIWALARGRRTDQRVQRQEKRSRTQERRLAKAIGEREVLDREVHHRVKNNLQVVSSLLNLQAQRISDGNTREEFMRSKRRIDSMALVHHKLYGQQDLRAIDLKKFMTQTASSVQAMFEPESRAVSHAVETGDMTADADTAIQLGIILCELLANCYQHAFPYATGGHIDISVGRAEGDLHVMTVKDNGQGLSTHTNGREARLGLEIVEALSEQIDGRMEVTVSEGTRVDVYFKMQGLRELPGGSDRSG